MTGEEGSLVAKTYSKRERVFVHIQPSMTSLDSFVVGEACQRLRKLCGVCASGGKRDGQSLNQLVSQSVSKSVSQSVSQSLSQLFSQLFGQPVS